MLGNLDHAHRIVTEPNGAVDVKAVIVEIPEIHRCGYGISRSAVELPDIVKLGRSSHDVAEVEPRGMCGRSEQRCEPAPLRIAP